MKKTITVELVSNIPSHFDIMCGIIDEQQSRIECKVCNDQGIVRNKRNGKIMFCPTCGFEPNEILQHE